jgi:hypothetical protein
MTTVLRRRGVVALGALALVALAWPIASFASARRDADAQEAVRLVRGTRAATEQHDFTGVATVTWTTARGAQRAQVRVTDRDGSVAVAAADGGAVVDTGHRTYLRDHLGWTGLLVEPTAHELPAPDHHWDLSTGGKRTFAGRPATVVVASRPGGAPAQRLVVDDATGLLLAREVLGPSGAVQRSLTFSSIDMGARVGAVKAPRDVRAHTAEQLTSTPDGYRAPGSAANFELVTRSRHPDGVLLFYSDGVFTASVFEQQGDLDWDSLPAGGVASELADTRTVVYHEPSGDVAVWHRDGLVYTCVTDAPSDVFSHMVGALASDERSTPESIVDFVLGPFGWG